MMSSTLCTRLLLLPLLFVQAPDRESIDTLIKKLGSPRFRERETATQLLLKRYPEAIPALKVALKSPDLEVANRAHLILESFQERPLRRLKQYVREGKIDLATELLAVWPNGKHEEACWNQARAMSHKIIRACRKAGKTVGYLVGTTDKPPIVVSAEHVTDGVQNPGSILFIRAATVNYDLSIGKYVPNNGCFILASDKVRIRRKLFRFSTVFAGGSVNSLSLGRALIVADGDVVIESGMGASQCLIVARGKVICRDTLSDSMIISGKSVVCNRRSASTSTIIENEPNPLGFIQFFDPTKEGITVEQAKNAVRISQVAAKKPYAKAGLKNGDVITSINGAKITSPDNFRRVLRKHVAWEEEMTFRVVRDGKRMEIKLRPLVLP